MPLTEPHWGDAFNSAFCRMTDFTGIKTVAGAIVGSVGSLVTADQMLAQLCFLTLTLDMLFRIILSVKRRRHRLLCRDLKFAIPRYIVYLLLIMMSIIVEISIVRGIGINLPIVNIMFCYLILTDCASILGTFARLGWYVPKPLRMLIVGGKKKIETQIEEATGVTDEDLQTQSEPRPKKCADCPEYDTCKKRK